MTLPGTRHMGSGAGAPKQACVQMQENERANHHAAYRAGWGWLHARSLTGRGLTWAEATAAGASPSLSDSSSLLLSESCSCFQAWAEVAAGPAFPGGAGAAPFLGGPVAEVALPWAFFPEGFAWE